MIKKEYNLEIREYSIRHTNIIVIKIVIILEKVKEKKKPSVGILDIITLAKVA